MLKNGMDALEAVTIAVEMLEDETLFNAGRGSVIAADGNITMDASIMQGHDCAAGSVINVKRVRNPIRVAKLILEKGWPVILNGDAGDKFGIENGVKEVNY
jgi:beta-aspartyl-peptidase (threonine type)